ncbi:MULTISPECIES: LysR family transcriptional regulator [unclassified Comamonas]|uniref:LysR family transcriptional regulator n=1 Tax=Comamonas squillarum TaxID=2977320 RepID=A0ABY6A1V4_9BURK|nr:MULTISPECIES: LysR family transcriptional regulator [unclassified Comamonas]PWB20332.1 LysR family transcriptional regulator [Comamonas sp. JNW]UXC18241.1 LysR family transcriptional regulator [Comamonas sp. PR12]
MNLLAAMRYLAALHAHGHFARAAQACHITQPALSNALRALEAEFGVAIVRRGRVFAGFTPEGEQVLQTGLEMLQSEARLRQRLSAQAGQLQGQLRMAAVPTAMPMLLRFASLLRQQHPGLVPALHAMSSPDIERGLEELSLDLALGYSDRIRRPRTHCAPQYQEHYYLLQSAPARACVADTLHAAEPLTWVQAAQQPLCLLTPDMHNRQIVERSFLAVGVLVQAAMETNSVQALLQAVGEGQMASIVPGAVLATVRHTPGLRAWPLAEPVVVSEVAFLYQQSQQAMPAMEAARALMALDEWQQQCLQHAGALQALATAPPPQP